MSHNYKFVTISLENEIRNNVLPMIFPMLNFAHKEVLAKYTIRLINIIALTFGFTDDDKYMYQLKQNDFQDIKWLISHLLPFLNEQGNPKTITSFDDIYVKKKKTVDINLEEPKYVYSNLQYNRCKRTPNDYTERKFNMKDLDDNFYLLLDTIKTMSNKMHVNWTDILPLTLKTYKGEQLYINTQKKMDAHVFDEWDPVDEADLKIGEELMCKNLNVKTAGLGMYDIYNTIHRDLFKEIYKVKWLLYDIQTANKIYPIVVILRNFFNLSLNLAQIDWENIDNEKFTYLWNKFVEESEVGNNITYKAFSIPAESLRKFMKGFLFSFDRSDSRKDAEKEKYIPIPQDKIKEFIKKRKDGNDLDEDDDFKDYEEDDDIPFSIMLSSLKSLHPKYVYGFLTDSLQIFKGTWYGLKILTNDKKDIDITSYSYFDTTDVDQIKIPITYKNIYNFSKSIVSYVDSNKKFVSFPDNWKSLNKAQQTEILDRLNEKNVDWFNIKKNIRKLFHVEQHSTTEDKINTKIREVLMNGIIDVVFEVLITKGVLTKFVPAKEKTSKKHIARDMIYTTQTNIFRTDRDNEYWTSAYHFLTNLPYNQMDNFTLETDGKIKTYNYFTWATTKDGGQWYSIYAYDWIAQIGFCHHFTNNRVMFITGATGVGKSTEIPKLFLYYTKAIDYIQNPKIVCTEPRIGPTRKNADWISKCLAVPISAIKAGDKLASKTSNYYIQTKFRGDESHSKKVSYPMLQYVTDGRLILDVDNPVMKEKYKIKNNARDGSKNDVEQIMFTNRNEYDVIMIDEAHEHKINMDLLLTLFKYAATYNNSIRLIILSATMDEDESRYRRFFRDINDNRKYPLNTWIKDHKLDRINVDRRYHISPPGMGTRYTVNEHYCPGKTEYDTVLEILSKSDSGDILVFEPGVKEINKLVMDLNKSIPANVIAFPYHSKLDDSANNNKKKFIEDISDTLKSYKLDKSKILSDPTVTMASIKNGNCNYDRAIIVATNIAEASITIRTLKYVVETGTQKIDVYNYKKRGNIQKIIFIAESNRIQRKGRAGRKSSGDVYYLYKKGALEENTMDYEISTKKIFTELFSKLRNKEDDAEIIVTKNDPNSNVTKLKYDEVEQIFGTRGLDRMIHSQYFLGTEYYDYYGNGDSGDYDNYESLEPFYESGLKATTLTDNNGYFYLIHPNELDFKRNIVGDIVEKATVIEFDSVGTDDIKFTKTNKFSGSIMSKKIKSFWQMLLDYLYVKFTADNTDIIRTEMGEEIIGLSESLQIDEKFYGLLRCFLFASSISDGIKNQMLKLMSFYMVTDMTPMKITQSINNKYNMAKHEGTSDSKIVLKYLNEFDQYLATLHVNNSYGSLAKKYYTNLNKLSLLKKMTRQDIDSLMGPEDLYTDSLISKMTTERKNTVVEESNKIIATIQENLIRRNLPQIIEWCNLKKLDPMIMIKYTMQYSKLESKIIQKSTEDTRKFIANLSNRIDRSVFIKRNVDPIDVCLLFGFPLNVCKKIDESDYYLSLYNPNLDNIYKINSYSPYNFKPNTLVDVKKLQEYLLYFGLDIDMDLEEDTLICLHKVDPNLITIMGHMYNAKLFNKIVNDTKVMEQIESIIKSKLKNKTASLSHAILNYTKTLVQIKNDLEYFNNKPNLKL